MALHGGAPNKNIGDAFLLVWKFPKGCTMDDIARVTSAPDSESTEVSSTLFEMHSTRLVWHIHMTTRLYSLLLFHRLLRSKALEFR